MTRSWGRIVVEMTNGGTFAFPPRLAQGLEAAEPKEIAAVEVLPGGYGLHWEILDVDLAMPDLVAGLFGRGLIWRGQAGPARPRARPPPRARTVRKAADPARWAEDLLPR
jgi:hypothetical protein